MKYLTILAILSGCAQAPAPAPVAATAPQAPRSTIARDMQGAFSHGPTGGTDSPGPLGGMPVPGM